MPERLRQCLLGLLFVTSYVFLDKASFLYVEHGVNIAPWNPALALALMCVMKWGKPVKRLWLGAFILSEILVRGMPLHALGTVVQALVIVYCYGALADFLRTHVYGSGGLGNQLNFIAWLMLVVFGTFITSCANMLMLFFIGAVRAEEWRNLVLRFWVGDCVGVIVAMPFLWLAIDYLPRLKRLFFRWETYGYIVLLVFMLSLAFGRWESDDFKYFHMLFLPLVWAAAVQGLAGVAVAAFVLQTGIIVAVQWLHLMSGMVFEFQLMGAVLASVGLYIGVLIDERHAAMEQLRKTLKLAAAGEMAGALAHEINQPLTALSAYGMVCEQLLAQGETGERLRETIKRMVAESHRAADVVRRLRDFFRTGDTRLRTVIAKEMVESAALAFAPKAERAGVALVVGTIPDSILLADRLQLEVVLRNLLSNALDAVLEHAASELREIKIAGYLSDKKHLCLLIEDSGAGLSAVAARKIFDAFHSTKSSGLGLGLAISRAIVEAHGGNLYAEPGEHGLFKLILPVEGEGQHGE